MKVHAPSSPRQPARAIGIRSAVQAGYRRLGPEKISALELARVQTYMAYTDLILGNLDVAERDLDEVRAIYSQELGPDHPEVQGINFTLARISEMRGDWVRAEEEMRAVVATETRVLGPGQTRGQSGIVTL